MTYLNIFIFLFILYIPLFFTFLLITVRKNKNIYFFYKQSISSLATLRHPYGTYFNVATSIYGLLSIFTIVKYFIVTEHNITSIIVMIIYLIISLGTFFVGIFPVHIHKRKHTNVAILLFSALFIFEIIFILIFKNIPEFISSVITAICLIVFTLILSYNVVRYKYEKIYSIWEWIVLIGTFIWNILFSITILFL